jgi:hypothetical protein
MNSSLISRGGVPQKINTIFCGSNLLWPKFLLSPRGQNSKTLSKSKNSSVFKLPNPKIGGAHCLRPKSYFYTCVRGLGTQGVQPRQRKIKYGVSRR